MSNPAGRFYIVEFTFPGGKFWESFTEANYER